MSVASSTVAALSSIDKILVPSNFGKESKCCNPDIARFVQFQGVLDFNSPFSKSDKSGQLFP